MASRTSPRSRSASTASRWRRPRSTGLSGLTQSDVYLALAKTPFGKPQQGQDLEGRQRQAAGDPDQGLRPAADQRHARLAQRADDVAPAAKPMPSMAALKKANEAKYQGDMHRASARTAPSSRLARTTISSSRSWPPTPTRWASSATASSRKMPQAEGRRDQRRAADLPVDLIVQISGRPSALHLRQECARPRDPGDPGLRRRVHQGKRDGPQRLSASRLAWSPLRTASAPARSRQRAT